MTRRLVLPLTMLCKEHGGIPRFNQMLCRALDELAPGLDLEVEVLSLHDSDDDLARLDPGWSRTRLRACGGAGGLARDTIALCARMRPDLLLLGHLGLTPLGPLCSPFVNLSSTSDRSDPSSSTVVRFASATIP